MEQGPLGNTEHLSLEMFEAGWLFGGNVRKEIQALDVFLD